jgi:oligopeptidase B
MNRRSLLQAGAAAPVFFALGACATGANGSPGSASQSPAQPMPPVAKKEPFTITQLGRTRTDDYHWLKDDNWQQVMRDPKVLRADIREYLEAENAYMKAMLQPTEALQQKLFEEMKGRIKEDDSTVPDADGPWEYYTRFDVGAQYPKHYRRPRGQTAETVLLDEPKLAEGKAHFDVGAAEHSPDHSLYGYAVDEQGSEYYTINLIDLATGATLPDGPKSSTGDFVFSPDSKYLFWLWRDEEGRPKKVYRRPIRGSSADDALIYEEKDDGMFVGLGVTNSREFIVIGCGNQETSESHIIPARTPTAAPRLFAARETGVLYDLEHWEGAWYIRTNADGAVDFKVMTTSPTATPKRNWQNFLAHEAGRLIIGIGAFKNHLVRLERVNALPRIVVREKGGAEHTVSFPEEAYALSLDGGYEWDTSVMRYVYNSPTTPRSWVDYDMNTRAKTVRKVQEIPSGHDPSKYVTKRFSAKAPDGAEVPITVLMKAGTKLDGSAPLLLYGYGSYGIPMEASFSIRQLSLVDRGWVWAIAHIRGGSEKGWQWFLDGRKDKKKNTFTDFIACAEDLITRGYATKGKIVAYGGSAGGLLMGAVTNMRPDLWAGVIAAVPFVDVINTMSDTTLPLTPPEWPEWGNPIEDPAAYDYIMSYSPYDQIRPQAYPAFLATGGLSDPRVTYWEPAKFVAKLRPNTTSGRPVLLKINMDAGHGGASGRFDFLKEIALDYAFALRAIGSEEAGAFAPVAPRAP